MYSVVLMAALTTGGTAPDCGWLRACCHASYSCAGCTGCTGCTGCYGGASVGFHCSGGCWGKCYGSFYGGAQNNPLTVSLGSVPSTYRSLAARSMDIEERSRRSSSGIT